MEYFLDNQSIGKHKENFYVPKVGDEYLIPTQEGHQMKVKVYSVVFRKKVIEVYFEKSE